MSSFLFDKGAFSGLFGYSRGPNSDVDSSRKFQDSLVMAMRAGDHRAFERALAYVEPALVSVGGAGALQFACRSGHLEMAQSLAAKGCDVNSVDATGWTPLYAACVGRSPEVVEFLLEEGARPDVGCVGMSLRPMAATSTYSASPLHAAVLWSGAPVVELLIEHGADVNAVDSDGVSVIKKAIAVKDEVSADVVRLLLDAQASLEGLSSAELERVNQLDGAAKLQVSGSTPAPKI